MKQKIPITITEVKNSYTDFKIFNVSLETLKLVEYTTFDLLAFNNDGCLTKLLKNFKEEGKACFLLFSTLTWHVATKGAAITNNVRDAIKTASTYFTISSISPSSSKLSKSLGKEICLLMLKSEWIHRAQKILDDIESMGTWCYFMFDYESRRDELFVEIEKIYKNNALGYKKSMLSLGLETVKFGSEGFWEGYEFEIYTRRFDKEQVKNLIQNSVGVNRFEVIAK